MTKRQKRWKIFGIVVAVIAVIWIIIAILPRQASTEGDNVFLSTDGTTMLIAHGGGNQEFPDNTMEAYYNAYSINSEVMLEADVSITADGVVIMSHDTSLDRRTNATGDIIDWTYTDLLAQKVDFGYYDSWTDSELGLETKYTNYAGVEVTPLDVTYPDGVDARDDEVFLVTTFEDMLVAFPDTLINIEIKQDGDTGMLALEEALRLVEEYDAFDRVMLASFHSEIFSALCDYYDSYQEEGITLLYSPEYGSAGTLVALDLLGLDALYTTPITALQIPTSLSILNFDYAAFVEMAHSHNIAVQYWTINDEETMRTLIEIGADGIMSDRPTLLQEVLDSYK